MGKIMDSREKKDRRVALKAAAQTKHPSHFAEDVLHVAQMYYEFLQGKSGNEE